MCSHSSVAISAPLYKWLFKSFTPKWRLVGYQTSVLVLTYIAYTSYHLAKKPFSVVKPELGPNCTVTAVNNTCYPWEPFDNPAKSKDLFGLLDCAFLMTYALSMFVSGYVAEHTNLRIYLSSGMVLTGLFTALFGMAFYFDIHSLSFFFLVQILTGITQSTGWPAVVEAVGVWFPEGRRGLIMGIWNTHTSVGNILGSAVAGAFVETNWGLSFIVPGIIIASAGIIMFFFLIPHPSQIIMETRHSDAQSPIISHPPRSNIFTSPDPIRSAEDNDEVEPIEPVEINRPIGIWGALRIPGVVEYSLCLFFAKLVSYTFLFWLPYYIENITIDGATVNSQDAADYAIFFDVGGAFGGILAGILNDITHHPGMVNVVMLLCAGPNLFLFYFYGTANLTLFITFMILSGFFVNGPYALITTAVSASLGTHECLTGNTKAMAVVTAIIDGTGSLGAAVGPLLAGVVSSKSSWGDVFYMLILADVIAALLLTRQFVKEVRGICQKINRRFTKRGGSVNYSDDEEKRLIT